MVLAARVAGTSPVENFLPQLLARRKAWPREVRAECWQGFWQTAKDFAGRCGLDPAGDSAGATQLRGTWWQVVSSPQGGHPQWVELVRLALSSLHHAHATQEDLEWYSKAMQSNAEHWEQSTASKPRVLSIRYADGSERELDTPRRCIASSLLTSASSALHPSVWRLATRHRRAHHLADGRLLVLAAALPATAPGALLLLMALG